MIVWIVLSIVLAGTLVLYIAAPLHERVQVESRGDSLVVERKSVDATRRLLDSKERALRAIKDLELDFGMGKVSKEDYDRSYSELSLEVGRILEELRRHE